MPFANEAHRLWYNRTFNRARNHGDFRQVYIDNGGMCQALLNSGDICGSIESLEFHAPLGEQNGNGFKHRTILCSYCHCYVDDAAHRHACTRIGRNGQYSLLSEDIAYEIALCGGFDKWLVKFNLVNRYLPTTIRINKD